MKTAEKCREIGLQIGDTIEGREGDGRWWNVTRLTLLWLGSEIAVWSQSHISSVDEEWSEPKEETNWSLDYRYWQKVTPNAESATVAVPRLDD